MTKFAIIENAKIQARMCFVGIAIPHQPSLADGVYGPIRSEKVAKFNRKALRKLGKQDKNTVNTRLIGREDKMTVKVGKPGSKERIAELVKQYSVVSRLELSPFDD